MSTDTQHENPDASKQIEAIHTMLASGHRSIRLEQHTLVLWGLAGAALVFIAELLITEARFPAPWQIAIAIVVLLLSVFVPVAWADYSLTRRVRRARGESISFVQRQIYKVWLLLFAMGTLMEIGMTFYGGGFMSYGIWMVLIGTGLFVHGLFSQRELETFGVLIIVLGIAGFIFKLPYEGMRWLAASVFGLGLPLIGLLLTFKQTPGPGRLIGLSSLWLASVGVVAVAIYEIHVVLQAPSAPSIPLAMFQQTTAPAPDLVVALPVGTQVTVKIDVKSDLFENTDGARIPLILKKPVEINLVQGKPNGMYRIVGSAWKNVQTEFWMEGNSKGTLTPDEGPVAGFSFVVQSGR